MPRQILSGLLFPSQEYAACDTLLKEVADDASFVFETSCSGLDGALALCGASSPGSADEDSSLAHKLALERDIETMESHLAAARVRVHDSQNARVENTDENPVIPVVRLGPNATSLGHRSRLTNILPA
jgi:hypothetical protein